MPAFPPLPKSMLAVPVVAIALGAGGVVRGDSSDVVMAKPTPSLQCAPSQTTQANLDAEVATLKAAGATVSSGACGNSGDVMPAACFYVSGDLWIISVSQGSVPIARSHGFSPIARFPTARKRACDDAGR